VANFFDQFEPKVAVGGDKPSAGNFFDQFEPKTAAQAVPKPDMGTAFYGALNLLPESVQKYVPSFLTGPSALERESQLPGEMREEEQRTGHKIPLHERITRMALGSPVAAGFATQQVGELPSGMANRMIKPGEKFINKTYNTAVKPPPSVINNADQAKTYEQHVGNAVNSILDNKEGLQFVDSEGGEIVGKTPKTMAQFRDAIGQTKEKVFQKYDDMVKKGEIAAIDVPLNNAAAELTTIANDKVTNTLNPKIAKYAKTKAAALSEAQNFTPVEAQKAIQQLNESLDAFYKNPSYKTANRAGVDAMVANILRTNLDGAITSSVGPGYQALKNEYGSLSAIEKHVARGAQRVANKEPGGGIFGRLADVASAEEVLRGLVYLNPHAMTSGILLKAVSSITNWFRSPNRAVSRIFDTAEKVKNAGQATPPIVPNIPVSPFMLTNQPTNIDQMVQQSGQ
jgi:hypothetical protein